MHEDGRHPPSRGASRASLGGRDKVQLVENANVERRPPPAQRAVEGLVKRLGFAALELIKSVQQDARRPVNGPRHDEARAEAQPRRAFGAVALDDFVRRKGQRAYRVRASIRDDVVGLQHKYDLMKQMVEGRPAPRPREKIGRR